MFTGLIQSMGEVLEARPGGMTRLCVRATGLGEPFADGESIALDGCCLTVVEHGQDRFWVEASPETLRRTTLGAYRRGTQVNLERALALGQRLGGHLVLGHVDAVGELRSRRSEGQSEWLDFSLPAELGRFLIEKGSVCVDGVSLTVNALGEGQLSVTLISETLRRTTLGAKGVGAKVNVEVDVLGKYVARLLGGRAGAEAGGLSEEALKRHGFA